MYVGGRAGGRAGSRYTCSARTPVSNVLFEKSRVFSFFVLHSPSLVERYCTSTINITQLRLAALAVVIGVIASPVWADPHDQVGPIDCGSIGTLVSHSPMAGQDLDPPQNFGLEKYLVKVTVPSTIPDPFDPSLKTVPCPVEVIHYTSQGPNQVPGITTLFTVEAGYSSSAPVYLEPKPRRPPGPVTGPSFPGHVGFECQPNGRSCQFSYTVTPLPMK
jgi:hypothetical protein